ncbi:hypothetical protein TSUD_133490 [Trifolium subterraneum]|uniref:RNase H type-1 domain-containing protein n=1 Tax=Trifolium subterraneum TaxID=3900 RepID=A0A2Z6NWV0_TRISU|nr:hypothetical protein TSUD_133490 [Trifolium subterraneum]
MWDREKIESLFPLHIANRNIDIPLFDAIEKDKLIWVDSLYGHCSVKSGYNLIIQARQAAGLDQIILPQLQNCSTAGEVIREVCSAKDAQTAGVFSVLLWVLWNNRNNNVRNDLREPGRGLGMKTRLMWEERNSVNQLQQQRQTADHQQPLMWQKPPIGWHKCNVDAGFHKNLNKTIFGWCLRDHLGRFVIAGRNGTPRILQCYF